MAFAVRPGCEMYIVFNGIFSTVMPAIGAVKGPLRKELKFSMRFWILSEEAKPEGDMKFS